MITVKEYLVSVYCGFKPLILLPSMLLKFVGKSLFLLTLGLLIAIGVAVVSPFMGLLGMLALNDDDDEAYMDEG